MKNNKFMVLALILVILLGGFLAFGYIQKATYKVTRPIVTMTIKDYGTIKMELYPDEAPNTVKNFIKLINEGYYNGLTFNRVEEELIQGGYTEEETGLAIEGEFANNGHENNLKFERGTVGLARESETAYAQYGAYIGESNLGEKAYDSGYGEFFIMATDEEYFDGNYTAFGKVIEGMDIVDTLTTIETEVETDEETGEETETSTPVDPPVIESITVDTLGENYGEPETQEKFDVMSYVLQKMYGFSY